MESKQSTSVISSLFKISVDMLMIFLPSCGYFFQAIKFKQTKSSKGFSKTLCLLLLLANIFRIYFWIGKPFSITLLYQSIIVIISQIYLIHYYLKYRENPKDIIYPEKSIIQHMLTWKETLNPNYIWNWYYEIEYYKFIIFLFFICSVVCSLVGIQNTKFFDIIGTISVSIETFIEIPQIKENCKTKNTKNLSGAMVIMWLLGDLFKTTYNIIYKSPMQMIIGGIIQNCEDLVLSSQVIMYSGNSSLGTILRKKYNYLNLDDNEKDDDNTINRKIDFDLENNSKDHMGILKINKNENNKKISLSNKKDDFEIDEEDDLNIETDIGKK